MKPAKRAAGGAWRVALCGLAFAMLAACGADGGDATTADTPGAILHSEPIQLFAVTGVPLSGQSYKMLYVSRDRDGRKVPVVGTLTVPRSVWRGPGERPIVAYATGTHGVSDNCAPSELMRLGIDYEAALVELLLLRGYAVVVTDYLGLGTDEKVSYINRLDQAHAVLDSIRAAQRLPEAGLSAEGPVATFGYSQGGLGSAAALELAPRYAPELDLVGGYAGAIPSDLIGALDTVDGTLYAGLMGNAIIALDNVYPQNGLRAAFNEAGQRYIEQTAKQCIPLVVVPHVLTQSRHLTVDGRTLGDHLRDDIWKPAFAALRIGQAAPTAPALVIQSIADDVVPFASTRDAAARWCEQGARVEFRVNPVPTHIGALIPGGTAAVAWLADRFDGLEPVNDCGNF